MDTNNTEEYEADFPGILETEVQVDSLLSEFKRVEAAKKRITDHANELRYPIDRWEVRQLKPLNEKLNLYHGMLLEWLDRSTEKGKGKVFDLVNGKLRRTAGRYRIEVLDIDALVEFAKKANSPYPLTRTKVEAEKTNIMKFVKETGEEPSGVAAVLGDDSFSVETH